MVLLFLSKTALFPSQKTKKVVDHITLSCIVKTPACKNRDKYALNPMYYKPTLKGLVLHIRLLTEDIALEVFWAGFGYRKE